MGAYVGACVCVCVLFFHQRTFFFFANQVLVLVPASMMRKKKLDKARKELDELQVASSSSVLEVVGAMRTVKAFAREQHEAALYGVVTEQQTAAEEKVARCEAAFMGTLDLGVKGSAVSVVAYGSSLVRAGHLSAGQLASFTMYSGLAGMGLAGLLRALGSDWQSPAWRLLHVINKNNHVAGAGGGVEAPKRKTGRGGASQLEGSIEFQGVEFEYSPTSGKVREKRRCHNHFFSPSLSSGFVLPSCATSPYV